MDKKVKKFNIDKEIKNIQNKGNKNIKDFNYNDYKNCKKEITIFYVENKEIILKNKTTLSKRQNKLYREKNNYKPLNIFFISIIIYILTSIFTYYFNNTKDDLIDIRSMNNYNKKAKEIVEDIEIYKILDNQKILDCIKIVQDWNLELYIKKEGNEKIKTLEKLKNINLNDLKHNNNDTHNIKEEEKEIEEIEKEIKKINIIWYQLIFIVFIFSILFISLIRFIELFINNKTYLYEDKLIEDELNIINELLGEQDINLDIKMDVLKVELDNIDKILNERNHLIIDKKTKNKLEELKKAFFELNKKMNNNNDDYKDEIKDLLTKAINLLEKQENEKQQKENEESK